MLLRRCQKKMKNYYFIRNSLLYIPIASNLVTNLSTNLPLNFYSSKCAINQLNSLIHQYNGDDHLLSSADQSSSIKQQPHLTSTELSSSSSINCLPKLDKFKLSDLVSVFYILNLNMEKSTDNLVNSLRKAFKNENVNEIMGLHSRMHDRMNSSTVKSTGKQFNFENLNQKTNQFKKSELLDSSILSKVKHVYHNTLNRLRFCSYHLKVNLYFI